MQEHDSRDAPESAISPFAKPETMVLHGLKMTGLRSTQWEAIYEALTFAITGICAIQSQPRCNTVSDRLNTAGDYLECLNDFLNMERTRLIENLHRHRPDNATDEHRRANLLVRYEAECGELSMPDMASYALSLSHDKH